MADLILTPELWARIKSDLASGVQLQAVAIAHNLRFKTVERRAYKEGYRAGVGFPAESSSGTGVSGRKKGKIVQPSKIVHVPPPPVFPLSTFVPPPVSPEAGAADFSSALVPHIQALVAAGLQSIEPPRNIAELKTLVELGRKLAGLDSKQSSGKVQLFAPLRDVSRRGGASQVVVDCENTVQTADCGDSIQDFEV
jgi:hypothetical protein